MEKRLEEKLAAKEFYDYGQLVKTLFFKYKMRKRETEMKQLIKNAMQGLSQNDQVRNLHPLLYT